MYKIFIKYPTANTSLSLYQCYREEDESGEIVEYSTSDLEEISDKVKELLNDYTLDDIEVLSTTTITTTVEVTEESDGE